MEECRPACNINGRLLYCRDHKVLLQWSGQTANFICPISAQIVIPEITEQELEDKS